MGRIVSRSRRWYRSIPIWLAFLLLAAAGLLLGWRRILLALALGSIIGTAVHLARMCRGAGRRLAFGPYLAAGIWLSALLGDRAIAAYLSLLGV